LLFFFWLLAANRQILFWLYLWQLKEYHLGRFLAHFETAKGKSLFLNPLFLAKIAILAIGLRLSRITHCCCHSGSLFLP